jgi:Fanconi anemia group M protein
LAKTEVVRLLEEHFFRNADSRVIIFTSFRASVDALIEVISTMPSVRCSRFVGQASSTGDSAAHGGQNQKEQRAVIDRFINGTYNTLVATCVGEEGLDIGECDLIILYDNTGSPVRLVQRVGRTGRKRQGKCVALLMEGFEANQYERTKLKGASILKSELHR